jgi:hypothetical protein
MFEGIKNFITTGTTQPTEGVAPVLTKKHLQALRDALSDPETNMSPMQRAFHQSLLNSYGDGKTPTGFSKRYDNLYMPFMQGVNSTTKADIIPNVYKESSPYDSSEKLHNKFDYNKRLNRLSKADPFITAGAKGIGLVGALGGGIPSFLVGKGLEQGLPAIWHLAKQKMAKVAAKKKEQNRYYKQLLAKHPLI